MDRQTIRFVFHLDVSDAQLEALLGALRGIRSNGSRVTARSV
jgi:hypothetical protein